MQKRFHRPPYIFVVRLDRVEVLGDDLPAYFGDPPLDHILTFPTSELNLNRRYRRDPLQRDERYISVFDDPNLENELANFSMWHEFELRLLHDEARQRWRRMQLPLETPDGQIAPGDRVSISLEQVVSAADKFDPGEYIYLGVNTEIDPPRPLFMDDDFKMIEVPWPPETFPWHDHHRIKLLATGEHQGFAAGTGNRPS